MKCFPFWSKRSVTTMNLKDGSPILKLFAFALILQTTPFQHSVNATQENGFYKAAVVEYKPEGQPWQETGVEIIAQNVRNYVEFIENASANDVDIIVFPEYGLTTLGVPRDRNEAKAFLLEVPDVGRNPCDELTGSFPIFQLSCEAKRKEIYVVVNLGEIRNCNISSVEECPPDGVFQYNTNVVFDRNGMVLAKYEKVTLFFEDMFDKGEMDVTFTTDFGVTFGLLTSFDMFFYKPGVALVDQGVKAFVFPTAWWDELPFNTAIQTQSSWAFGSDSVLLAAAYHQPGLGQLGSGIYQGRKGALGYTSDPDSGSKMVISTVYTTKAVEKDAENFVRTDIVRRHFKKRENVPDEHVKGYQKFLHEDLQNYTTRILELKQQGEEVVCTEEGFCCSFEYTFSVESQEHERENANSFVYRIVAFNGTRPVAQKTSGFEWQVCGLLRCGNSSLESCSEISEELVFDVNGTSLNLPNFDWIKLSAKFDISEGRMFLPMVNAIDMELQLINLEQVNMDVDLGSGVAVLESTGFHEIPIKTLSIINKLYEF